MSDKPKHNDPPIWICYEGFSDLSDYCNGGGRVGDLPIHVFHTEEEAQAKAETIDGPTLVSELMKP